MKRLETKRLILRKAELGDISSIFEASQYEGFNDGLGWDAPDAPKELESTHQRNLKAWDKGDGFAFSMEHKIDGDMIGRITIRKTKRELVWNTGFWTHPMFQGNGYMKEALKAVVAFGFVDLEANRIEADYANWNVASGNLLSTCGFTIVGKNEKGFLKKGKWVPNVQVAIDRADWSQ